MDRKINPSSVSISWSSRNPAPIFRNLTSERARSWKSRSRSTILSMENRKPSSPSLPILRASIEPRLSKADCPISKISAPARSRLDDSNSRNCGKKVSSAKLAIETLQKIPTFLSVLASRLTICTQRNSSKLSIAVTSPSGSATERYSAGIIIRPVSSLSRE